MPIDLRYRVLGRLKAMAIVAHREANLRIAKMVLKATSAPSAHMIFKAYHCTSLSGWVWDPTSAMRHSLSWQPRLTRLCTMRTRSWFRSEMLPCMRLAIGLSLRTQTSIAMTQTRTLRWGSRRWRTRKLIYTRGAIDATLRCSLKATRLHHLGLPSEHLSVLSWL